ncbi:hypothetical protein DV738_g80, partial [Chaetothyriales sp. CBS 135597]
MAPYTYLQAQPTTTAENVNQEAFPGEYAQFNDSPQWNNYHHQHYDGSVFSPTPYTTSHSPTLDSYGGAAHGFHLAPPMAKRSSTSSPYENGDSMWSDIDRHSRYLSPLSSGTSLSGADSTRSDHPPTPDAPGDLPYVIASDTTYLSPCSEPQEGQSHPVYLSQSPVSNDWSPPLPSSLHPLNMRDFELSPVVPPQNYLATELHNPIVANVKSSESFNLADNPKLNDSRPVDQEMELDQDKLELSDERSSESDLPSALPSRQSGATSLRSSTRSRRPTRSATHGVVQDINAHIHKPTSSRTKSKAKATRKRRAASLDASSGSKSRSRAFYCPFAAFGCESVFPTKNEWKRHTAAQHLQVDFYRCDMGGCSASHPNQVTIAKGHNDFNRKDLFTQHCRRMHWDECEGLQRSKIKGKEWASWTSREKGIFESFMEMDPGLRQWCEENEMGVWINDKYWLSGCGPVGEEKQEKGGIRKRRTRARRSSSLLNHRSPASPASPDRLAQHDLDCLGQHLDNHHDGGHSDSDDTDADGESD